MKVLQYFILHKDGSGKSHVLAEVITTDRSSRACHGPLAFIDEQLSRLKEGGNDSFPMSHQSLRPSFTITDKDMAELNCLAKALNGVK